ncbi:MAG: hypothetical protein AB1779_10635, partial [Candidatus Thermoplasmatota archaeon]
WLRYGIKTTYYAAMPAIFLCINFAFFYLSKSHYWSYKTGFQIESLKTLSLAIPVGGLILSFLYENRAKTIFLLLTLLSFTWLTMYFISNIYVLAILLLTAQVITIILAFNSMEKYVERQFGNDIKYAELYSKVLFFTVLLNILFIVPPVFYSAYIASFPVWFDYLQYSFPLFFSIMLFLILTPLFLCEHMLSRVDNLTSTD